MRRLDLTLASLLFVALAAAPAAPAGAQDDEPPRWPTSLERRMTQVWVTGDPARTAARMLNAIAEEPRLVESLEEGTAWAVIATLQREGESAMERRVLETLIGLDWQPAGDLWPRRNSYDERLARLQLAAGDADAAAATLAQVEWRSASLIDALTDRRNEPLWAGLEAAPGADLATVVESDVARAETLRAQHPDRLEPIRILMLELRRAGRPQEAARVGAETLASLIAPGAELPVDGAGEIGPFVAGLALALADSGDMPEAHAIMASAADPELLAQYISARPSELPSTVYQEIQVARLLVFDGRAEAALAALENLPRSELTDYDEAFVAAMRVCAAVQLPDAAAADDALSRLEQWLGRYPDPVKIGYTCANRVDEAVALTVWQLQHEGEAFETEARRRATVFEMQRVRRAPYVPPFHAAVKDRLDQVRGDPRVLEAIAPYGRILSWDVTGS